MLRQLYDNKERVCVSERVCGYLTIRVFKLEEVMASFRLTGDPRDTAPLLPLPPSSPCPGESIPESMDDSDEDELRPRMIGSSRGDE